MNRLTEIWTRLDPRRRAVLIGGAVALLVITLILARLVAAPSYALLYSGLDPAASGDVITAIEARGIPYRVQGDAIHVDAAQRDSLRMALAGDGLPRNGAAGYELLDGLSGFGTTSQMFDAAYWRAREGELARTIAASPRVRGARVHIANPGSDPFQPTQDVTASVAIQPAAGGLSAAHARALRYLVSSSIPGMLPENVTVLDADSGQLLAGGDMTSPATDASDRAETLRRNIERLLAARVGPGNAVVQVSVELTTARETILERHIDPDSRVVISTDTEERDDSSSDAQAAGVSVASNLPDGDASGAPGQSTSRMSESRERVTYDMSETQREIEQAPGDIRRISVAVLLNGVAHIGPDGQRTVTPRPAEEVEALRDLVRSAIGYDGDRGDAVTIESMAFDDSVTGPVTAPGLTDRMTFDLGRVIQSVVLAAAALFIAFGLLRPLLTRPPEMAASAALTAESTPGVAVSPPAPMDRPGLPNPAGAAAATDTSDPTALKTDTAGTTAAGLPALPPGLPDPGGDTDMTADPVARLRRLIEEREEETVEILRAWMDEDEEIRP